MKTFFVFSLFFLLGLASQPRSLSIIPQYSGLQFVQNFTESSSLLNFSFIQSSLYIPDPEFYITGDNCGNLSFWNLTSGNLSFQYQLSIAGIPNASNLTILCSMPNRTISQIIWLESAGKIAFYAGNILYFLDVNSKSAKTASFNDDNITSIAFLNKRDWVASGDESGVIAIWDTSGTFIKRSWVPTGVLTMDNQYDTNFLLVAGENYYISLINIESGHVMKSYFYYGLYPKLIKDLRYTDLMAVGFHEGTLCLLNKHNWKVQTQFFYDPITSLFWDYHNNLLSVGQNKSIIWINITNVSNVTYQKALLTDSEQITSSDIFAKQDGFSYFMVIFPQKVMIFKFNTQRLPHAANSTYIVAKTALWQSSIQTSILNILHYRNDENHQEFIITGDSRGTINVLNITSGSSIKSYTDLYNRPIAALVQIGNTSQLAYAVGKEIIIWDESTNEQKQNLTGHLDKITSLRYNRETNRLISGSLDGYVKIWDPACCAKDSLNISSNGVLDVDYIEGTQTIIVLANQDTSIQFYSLTDDILVNSFEGGQQILKGLINIPDTPYFLTSGSDNTTVLRNKFSYETVRIFQVDGAVTSFSYDPIFNLLLVTSDKTVNALDVSSFTMSQINRENSQVSAGLFFYPDIIQGPYSPFNSTSYSLMVDASQNFVQSWNLTISFTAITEPNQTNSSSLLQLIASPLKTDNDGIVLSYGYSASLQYVITGNSKGYIKIWDATSGNLLKSYKTDSDQVQMLQVLNPDTLIAFTERKKIKILDLNTFSLKVTLDDHSDNITSLSYNKDYRILITGSLDGTVRVWNTDNMAVQTTIYAFLSGVSQVLFHVDSGYLICSGISEDKIMLFMLSGEKVGDFTHGVQSVTKMIDIGTSQLIYYGLNVGIYSADLSISNQITPIKILEANFTPTAITYDAYHNTLIISTSDEVILYNLSDQTRSFILNESLSWTFIASSFEIVQETPYRFDTILIEETESNLKFWNITYNDTKPFTPNGSNYYLQYFKSIQLNYKADLLLHIDNGERIVTADSSQKVLNVIQPSTGETRQIYVSNSGITAFNNLVLASESGELIAVSTSAGAFVYNTTSLGLYGTFDCGTNYLMSLTWDFDRKFVIQGDSSGSVSIYNVSNRTCNDSFSFMAHQNGVNTIQYLGDSELLTSGINDNTVKLWTLKNNTMLSSFVGPRQAAPINLGAADDNSAFFGYLPTSKFIMVSGYGTVYAWNRENSTILKSFLLNSTVTGLQAISDKNILVLRVNNSIYFINAFDYNISLITNGLNQTISAVIEYTNSSNGANYLMMSNNQGAIGIYQVVNFNGNQNKGESGGSEESSSKAWIAGVVIGALAVIVIIGLLIGWIVKRNRKKHEEYGGYKHFNDTHPQKSHSHKSSSGKQTPKHEKSEEDLA